MSDKNLFALPIDNPEFYKRVIRNQQFNRIYKKDGNGEYQCDRYAYDVTGLIKSLEKLDTWDLFDRGIEVCSYKAKKLYDAISKMSPDEFQDYFDECFSSDKEMIDLSIEEHQNNIKSLLQKYINAKSWHEMCELRKQNEGYNDFVPNVKRRFDWFNSYALNPSSKTERHKKIKHRIYISVDAIKRFDLAKEIIQVLEEKGLKYHFKFSPIHAFATCERRDNFVMYFDSDEDLRKVIFVLKSMVSKPAYQGLITTPPPHTFYIGNNLGYAPEAEDSRSSYTEYVNQINKKIRYEVSNEIAEKLNINKDEIQGVLEEELERYPNVNGPVTSEFRKEYSKHFISEFNKIYGQSLAEYARFAEGLSSLVVTEEQVNAKSNDKESAEMPIDFRKHLEDLKDELTANIESLNKIFERMHDATSSEMDSDCKKHSK